MKNRIFLSLLSFLIVGLSGCNLDKYPHDRIPQSESIRTVKDVIRFQQGNYAEARSYFGKNRILIYDLMGDYMNSTLIASNTYGGMIRWQFGNNVSEIYDQWRTPYKVIGNINYLLSKIDDVPLTSMNDTVLIQSVNAEVRVLRAMTEHQLLLRYCKSYNRVADPKTELGIASMRKFDPYAKPARNTLYESYNLLLQDIDYAKKTFEALIIQGKATRGTPNADEINLDCVYALEAQVCLQMGLYKEAAQAASNVIKSPASYALINNKDAFAKMWKEDIGTELIFTFFADQPAPDNSDVIGSWFRDDPTHNESWFKADFIPTQGLIDMYNEYDIRKAVYFIKAPLKIGDINHNIWLLNKYPGNPALFKKAEENDYRHKSKVFRLADMYLIAAEAYTLDKDFSSANNMLNVLCKSRIMNYTNRNLTEDQLKTAIKEERLKEMVMEGTRISDLKRWGDNIKRSAPQTSDNGEVTMEDTVILEKDASNYMFVWPIPLSELNANSNMRRQQNPGW